jgi:hypothetical protein
MTQYCENELELRTRISLPSIAESHRNGVFAELLCPDVVLEGVVRRIISNQFVLSRVRRYIEFPNKEKTYNDIVSVDLALVSCHDGGDVILESFVKLRGGEA